MGYDFIDRESFFSPHVSFIPWNYIVSHVWNISSKNLIFKLKKFEKYVSNFIRMGKNMISGGIKETRGMKRKIPDRANINVAQNDKSGPPLHWACCLRTENDFA
jgi:hypothetical protein